MDNFDFAEIGAMPAIEEVQDGDTVLVVRDGALYRAPKDAVGGGGAGGYLYEPDPSTVSREDADSQNTLIVTDDCTDMLAAAKAGSSVTLVLPASVFDDGLSSGNVWAATLITTFDDAVAEVLGGIAAIGAITMGATVCFTNGATLSSASVASLKTLGGNGNAVV